MTEPEPAKIDRRRQPRDQKTELDSRTFRNGAISLFRRADYKKLTWFCRVKVPGAKGCLSCSTKTTDEHEAFKLHIAEAEQHRSRVEDKKTFFERVKAFFAPFRLQDVTTATPSELNDWLRVNSRTGTLSPNSIRRYSADIRQFLNGCVERGFLEHPNCRNKVSSAIDARISTRRTSHD